MSEDLADLLLDLAQPAPALYLLELAECAIAPASVIERALLVIFGDKVVPNAAEADHGFLPVGNGQALAGLIADLFNGTSASASGFFFAGALARRVA